MHLRDNYLMDWKNELRIYLSWKRMLFCQLGITNKSGWKIKVSGNNFIKTLENQISLELFCALR